MKKSELVALIKKELDEDDLTGDLTWVAQHIVSICERAGMLPPLQDKEWPKDNPEQPINWRMWESESS